MSENTSSVQGGMTRREMLKKSALVGAVAWATPVISSLNTPAYAQQNVVSPAACTTWDCGDPFDICGTTGPLGQCLCDVDVNGDSFCWEDILCTNSPPCTTNTDCPPGWRCTTNCCGTSCLPECGTTNQANSNELQRQGGATASGR
jgi:hypothetical protein